MKTKMLATGVYGLLLTACFLTGFDAQLVDRKPFTPLPIYVSWWSDTEDCSGLTGDYQAVRWYTAAGITLNGVVARAAWYPPHEIIIVLGYEEHEATVRHEMLHDLLRGDSDHTSPAWHACDLIVK